MLVVFVVWYIITAISIRVTDKHKIAMEQYRADMREYNARMRNRRINVSRNRRLDL